MYVKTVNPLLQKLTEVSHFTYGIYLENSFLFNNFGFDATKISPSDETVDFNNLKYSLVSFEVPVHNASEVRLFIAKENTESLQRLDSYRRLSFAAIFAAIILISVIL